MSACRILVLNPNTDPDVTRMMVAIAAQAAPPAIAVEGATVASGARLILDPGALEHAARAVCAMAPTLAAKAYDGVVVSAFGDPGMAMLRDLLPCPVEGLAEASMAAAAAGDRRFCVVTTTPQLAPAIDRLALAYGHDARFAGTFCTPGDPGALMSDPAALAGALQSVCESVVAREGVEAIVIGGGPLARVAREIEGRLRVPLVEPVPEAVARLARRIAGRPSSPGRPKRTDEPARSLLAPSAPAR